MLRHIRPEKNRYRDFGLYAKLIVALVGITLALALAGCQRLGGPSATQSQKPLPFDWPPVLGKPYPNLMLKNHRGDDVRLDSYKGRILLIEPIGMSCPACNAYAGAGDGKVSGFGGVRPQPGLRSLAHYMPLYTKGISASNPRVMHVQLLLYGPTMQAPTQEEACAWAEHFGIDGKPNHLVLVGDPRMMGQASFNMIPGFQLVDRQFILRSDSTGHRPRHNLYTDLLPQLGQLVRR